MAIYGIIWLDMILLLPRCYPDFHFTDPFSVIWYENYLCAEDVMGSKSINKVKLTKRVVDSAVPDPIKRVFLWDTEITGFGLRLYPSGQRSYYLQYRNQYDQTRKIKIGNHGSMATEQARDIARQLSLEIGAGRDPAEGVKETKAKPTIEALVNEYLNLHARVTKREKSLQEDERLISTIILPRLGSRRVEAVTANDLQNLHKDLIDTPYVANRVRSLMSKMFNMAIQWEWISSNPTTAVTKYQEHKRERWLDKEEMAKLWEVLDKYASHATSFVFKFLLLTGARKGEVLYATWNQFDLDKGVWTKPAHLTKQKKIEHLPLSTNALDMLQQLKELHPSSSPFLFPGKVEGKPIQEVKTFWGTVLKEAGIENFRIHDLRHTHASHLVSSGLSLSVVGKLLGHTQASTTQRYAHLADEPLREAAELFGNMVGKKK
jgi:integrase